MHFFFFFFFFFLSLSTLRYVKAVYMIDRNKEINLTSLSGQNT